MSFLNKIESNKKHKVEAAKWVKGNQLSSEQQKKVLNAYIYRWTKENTQREQIYNKLDSKPTIPLISDTNLSKEDKSRLDNAKDKLRALYN